MKELSNRLRSMFSEQPDVKAQLVGFVDAVRAMQKAHYEKELPGHCPPLVEVSHGSKYARVLVNRAAWCFIDLSNGDILKPDGFKKPAKHARGNIMREDYGMGYLTPYGPHYLK